MASELPLTQPESGPPSCVMVAIVLFAEVTILRRGTVQRIRSCRGVTRSFPHSLSMAAFIPNGQGPKIETEPSDERHEHARCSSGNAPRRGGGYCRGSDLLVHWSDRLRDGSDPLAQERQHSRVVGSL